jgi:uncharacterized protein YndB with AHSA1/START domain
MSYSKAKYAVEIGLSKPAHIVFNLAIDLAKWWPEEFVGEGIRPGAEFVLKTGEGHYSKNKVVEFVQDKKLAWLTTESIRKADNFDWSGTKFIFEVAANGEGTRFRFTYDGVVLEHETARLAEICDVCIREMFYNFVESYRATIEVAKPAHAVFRCITEDVARWWGGTDLTGGSTRVNDEFVIDHPGTHYSKQKVVELIPDKKVVWLVTESRMGWLRDQGEWTDTKMVFELTGEGNKTVLRFAHEGLTPDKECFSRCSEGWSMVIKDWLLDFIAHGQPHF